MSEPSLYQLATRQWQHAGDRGGVYADCTAWMQAPHGQQLLLCRNPNRGAPEFWIDPIDFTSRRLTDGGWATQRGEGVSVRGERTATPVPGQLTEMLAGALPIPRPDQFHGYRRDGVTTALIYIWEPRDNQQGLCCTTYVLRGADRPEHLYNTRDGQSYLDMAAWWPAVDAGHITALDIQVAASAHPVEVHTVKGCGELVLVRGPETWTGVPGPALYATSGAGDVTLDRALPLQGLDIRRQVHGAAG
jgi:hypothetical protein